VLRLSRLGGRSIAHFDPGVVDVRENSAEVAHVEIGSTDRAIAEMIGLVSATPSGSSRDNSGLPSSTPRQLAASPMLVFPVGVEHALDVTVQCWSAARRRKYRKPVPGSARSS
jgi:hypothetical protein